MLFQLLDLCMVMFFTDCTNTMGFITIKPTFGFVPNILFKSKFSGGFPNTNTKRKQSGDQGFCFAGISLIVVLEQNMQFHIPLDVLSCFFTVDVFISV